ADVILAQGSSTVGPLLQATRAIPIVFVIVPDPVSAGFVDSLARPGGNATGFLSFEYSISAKWLELLKQIAPGLTQVAVLRDSTLTAAVAQMDPIPLVGPSFREVVTPVNSRRPGEIGRAIRAWRGAAN